MELKIERKLSACVINTQLVQATEQGASRSAERPSIRVSDIVIHHQKEDSQIKSQLQKIKDLAEKKASQILDERGRRNLTVFTYVVGGMGDLVHGINLQKYLKLKIPNIALHWIIISDKKYSSVEKIETFLDTYSGLNDTQVILPQETLDTAETPLFPNHPESLSIVCPVTLPEYKESLLPLKYSESIFLQEIYRSQKPRENYSGHIQFGFSALNGVGLPIVRLEASEICPLNKCLGFKFLPKKDPFFFAYFSQYNNAQTFEKCYQFISIMNQSVKESTPTFVMNWNAAEGFDTFFKDDIRKKLSMKRIEYFGKGVGNTFKKTVIDLNPTKKKTVRVINPFPIPRDQFLSFMKSSRKIVGCTGDSSLSEAIALDKIPYYDPSWYITVLKGETLTDLSDFTTHSYIGVYLKNIFVMQNQVSCIERLLEFEDHQFAIDRDTTGYDILCQAILAGL